MCAQAAAVDAYLIFGRLAVKFNRMTPDDLKVIVDLQNQPATKGQMFGDLCVQKGFLSAAQRDELLNIQLTAPVRREGSFFGYLAMVNGFVSQKQLALALKEQEDAKAKGAPVGRLGEVFQAQGVMKEGQVQAVLRAQERIRRRLQQEAAPPPPKPVVQPGQPDKAEPAVPSGTAKIGEVGKDRAAEALAKLREFEAQYGAIEARVEETAKYQKNPATGVAEPVVAPVEMPPDAILPAAPKEFADVRFTVSMPVVRPTGRGDLPPLQSLPPMPLPPAPPSTSKLPPPPPPPPSSKLPPPPPPAAKPAGFAEAVSEPVEISFGSGLANANVEPVSPLPVKSGLNNFMDAADEVEISFGNQPAAPAKTEAPKKPEPAPATPSGLSAAMTDELPEITLGSALAATSAPASTAKPAEAPKPTPVAKPATSASPPSSPAAKPAIAMASAADGKPGFKGRRAEPVGDVTITRKPSVGKAVLIVAMLASLGALVFLAYMIATSLK